MAAESAAESLASAQLSVRLLDACGVSVQASEPGSASAGQGGYHSIPLASEASTPASQAVATASSSSDPTVELVSSMLCVKKLTVSTVGSQGTEHDVFNGMGYTIGPTAVPPKEVTVSFGVVGGGNVCAVDRGAANKPWVRVCDVGTPCFPYKRERFYYAEAPKVVKFSLMGHSLGSYVDQVFIDGEERIDTANDMPWPAAWHAAGSEVFFTQENDPALKFAERGLLVGPTLGPNGEQGYVRVRFASGTWDITASSVAASDPNAVSAGHSVVDSPGDVDDLSKAGKADAELDGPRAEGTNKSTDAVYTVDKDTLGSDGDGKINADEAEAMGKSDSQVAATDKDADGKPDKPDRDATQAEPERRVDPHDGRAYTFQELSAYYAKQYNPAEIQTYWNRTCKPVKPKKRNSGGNMKAGSPKAKAST